MKGYYSYEFGAFRLVPSERLLHRNGEPVSLKPKAFDVLCVLVERAGKLVTKDELLKAVWPDTSLEPGRVESTISEIKKTLGGGKKDFIENVRRAGRRFEGGYRFVAKVFSREEPIEPAPILCPFPGLPPLYAEDAEYFFGRETDLQRLVEKLHTKNFLAVLARIIHEKAQPTFRELL